MWPRKSCGKQQIGDLTVEWNNRKNLKKTGKNYKSFKTENGAIQHSWGVEWNLGKIVKHLDFE